MKAEHEYGIITTLKDLIMLRGQAKTKAFYYQLLHIGIEPL